MPLTAGTRLGPYEILALIGAGGMGEVYRARDTRLGRDVAIKVSTQQFTERFEREARAIAALNHPNICTLYDVGPNYLVMEYIEGQALAGPVPLDEALRFAAQIAEALAAAHEKGIVHRDLKPANIKITPEGVVKVLDFGLATAAEPEVEQNPETLPTLTMRATQLGMIVGTAAYMAPEQARGKKVDRRADIWAFGVVLYEVLTGQRLFEGETISDILAQVLTKQPDWTLVPAEMRRLLQMCLQQDPKQRLQGIGDWRLLMEDVPAIAPSRSRFRNGGWVAAGVLAVALIVALVMLWPRPIQHPLMRMSVDLGPEAVAGPRTTVAISPDGTRIVFPMRGTDGKQQLATRLLDQATPTLLPGTEDAADPFFSPDGQWIGFSADAKLKKISVLGGAAVTLCDAPAMRGASWGDDGNIIAALNAAEGLSRIPAGGGMPGLLTKPSREERTHRWPQVLPGASAVLFMASANANVYDDANLQALSLKTGEIKILVRGGYFGRYLPTNGSTGHLVYIHEGVLFGVPFDPVKLELRGAAVPVLEDMAGDPSSGGGQLDFSRAGIFAYQSGKSSAQGYPVVWLDSTGKTQPLIATPSVYNSPRFSPDGRRLALSMTSAKGRDVYVYDTQRDALSRLTFTGQGNTPIWTPDGRHIVFWSAGSFWWIRADGAGEAQRLLESKNQMFLSSFSPDGRRFAYTEITPETKGDSWILPLDLSDSEHPKPGKPEMFLHTPFSEGAAVFSPDGRWLSYTSDESGKFEVYVRPFQSSQGRPGGKWQISTGGGSYSFWSRDGRELLFEALDNRIMVADYIVKGDSFMAGKPRVWSDTQIRPAAVLSPPLDLAPDGKRLAILPRDAPAEAQRGSVHVTFLLNFFDELRRRVPAR